MYKKAEAEAREREEKIQREANELATVKNQLEVTRRCTRAYRNGRYGHTNDD